MICKPRFTLAVIPALFTCAALAAVSAEEAKQLGTTLTPVGAVKAGNADGTIPEWNNDGVKPPASFNRKRGGQRPTPWPNEKPLFTITAQNMDKYLDKISEGEIAMLKKYPDFKMNVYPTHRVARYPDYLLQNSIKNATQCKLDAKDELSNCLPGIPFPIPKSGVELVWNHTMAIQQIISWGDHSGWLIDSSGNLSNVGTQTLRAIWPVYLPENKDKILTPDTVRWKYRQQSYAPAREAGSQIMIIDRVSAAGTGRRAWQYIPGQRRVKLAPDLSFDTPLPQGGSASTFDDVYTFFGSPERYTWKILGKKETYLRANNYQISDPASGCGKMKDLVRKGFPNPDCIRFELRRAWVVQADLKPTARHIYPKRVFYWDEDNLNQVGTGVNYDAAGKVYRVSYSMMTAGYNLPGPPEQSIGGESFFIINDLVNGSWLASGFAGETEVGWAVGDGPEGRVADTHFSPEAMAGGGVR